MKKLLQGFILLGLIFSVLSQNLGLLVERKFDSREKFISIIDQASAQTLVDQINKIQNFDCSNNNPTFPLSSICQVEQTYGSAIFWKFTVTFNEPKFASQYNFKFVEDFKYGYVVVLDGKIINLQPNMPKFQGDWNSALVIRNNIQVTNGLHQLIIYGQGFQLSQYDNFFYQRNNDPWTTVNNVELQKTYDKAKLEQDSSVYFSFETRQATSFPVGANSNDFYKSILQLFMKANQPAGYCFKAFPNQPMSSQGTCGGPNSNILFKYSIIFQTKTLTNYQFRYGLDAGKGGVILVDNQPVTFWNYDVWWGLSWASNQIVYGKYDFQPGVHKIVVLSAEGCCDGGQQIQFSKNNGAWVDFSPSNLQNSINEEDKKAPVNFVMPQPAVNVAVDEYQNPLQPEAIIADPDLDPEIVQYNSKEIGLQLERKYISKEQFVEILDKASAEKFVASINSLTFDCSQNNVAFPLSECDVQYPYGQGAIYKYTITFAELKFYAQWNFKLAEDFRKGYVVVLDGKIVNLQPNLIKFSGDWNSGQVIRINQQVGAGKHTLIIYGQGFGWSSLANFYFQRNNDVWAQVNDKELIKSIEKSKAEQNNNVFFSFETRQAASFPGGAIQEDFSKSIQNLFVKSNQPGGYCFKAYPNQPLYNQGTCGGPNSNILYKFSIIFKLKTQTNFQFRYGLDAGKGGVILVDNQIQNFWSFDIWWGGNWASDQIKYGKYDFQPGIHKVLVYSAEGCCDGGQQIQFSKNGDVFVDFNPTSFSQSILKEDAKAPKNFQIPAINPILAVEEYQNPLTPLAKYNDPEADPEFVSYDIKEIGFKLERKYDTRDKFIDIIDKESAEKMYTSINQFQFDCAQQNIGFPLGECEVHYNYGLGIFWRYTVTFAELQFYAQWNFKLAEDFTKGYTIVLDGKIVNLQPNALRFGGDWNSNQVIRINQQVGAGKHVLQIYGQGFGWNSLANFYFSRNNDPWAVVSDKELLKAMEKSKLDQSRSIFFGFETRQAVNYPSGANQDEFSKNMQNIFVKSNQPAGYCNKAYPNQPLNSQGTCGGPNSNILFKYSIIFRTKTLTNYQFRYGLDAGKGGVILVDNQITNYWSNDVWWAGNWASDQIKYGKYDFQPGVHKVIVFFAEGCCDGGSQIQFSKNGGAYADFNPTSFQQSINDEDAKAAQGFKIPPIAPNLAIEEYISPVTPEQKIQGELDPEYVVYDIKKVGLQIERKYDSRDKFVEIIDKATAQKMYSNIDSLQFDCVQQNVAFPLGECDVLYQYGLGIFWRYTINFVELQFYAQWNFKLAEDFTKGYTVVLDGKIVNLQPNALKFGGDWNSNQVIRINQQVGAGQHVLQIYGQGFNWNPLSNFYFARNNDPWAAVNDKELLKSIEKTKSEQIRNIFFAFETRQAVNYPSGANQDEFSKNIQNIFVKSNQPAGYCNKAYPNQPLNSQGTCGGPNSNILFKYSIIFKTKTLTNYQFRYGLDAGRGGVILVDNQISNYWTNDVWWAGNWASDQIKYGKYDFQPGVHKVQVYYAEGCCDGGSQIQFSKNGGGFIDFNPSIFQQSILDEDKKAAANFQIPPIAPNLAIEEYVSPSTPEQKLVAEPDPEFIVYDIKEIGLKIERKYTSKNNFVDVVDKISADKLVEQMNQIQQFDCTDINVQFPLQQCQAAMPYGSAIFTKFTITFAEFKFYGNWQFKFGIDLVKKGFAIQLDGKTINAQPNLLTFSGDFESPNVVRTNIAVPAGQHKLVIYGQGFGNSQVENFYFSRNNENWALVNNVEILKMMDKSKSEPERNTFFGVETRQAASWPSGANKDDFNNNFQNLFLKMNQPKGYCTKANPNQPINSQSTCQGPNQNIFFKFTIAFKNLVRTNFKFRFGLDSGKGGVFLIDNNAVDFWTNDVWWGGDWNNPGIKYGQADFESGTHKIIVYSGEGCCDGGQQIQFSKNGGGFIDFNLDSFGRSINEENVKAPVGSKYPQIDPKIAVQEFLNPLAPLQRFQDNEPEMEEVDYDPNNIVFTIDRRYLKREHFVSITNKEAGQKLVNYVNQFPSFDCTQQNPSFPLAECEKELPIGYGIFWRYTVKFAELKTLAQYNFKLAGTDFKKGYVVVLDGKIINIQPNQLQFSGDWNSNQVIRLNIFANSGMHILQVYGQGFSFGSNGNFYFQRNNDIFYTVTGQNLLKVLEKSKSDAEFNIFYSLITKQAVSFPVGENQEDFSKSIKQLILKANQPNGYCSKVLPNQPFSNQATCGGGNQNILYKLTLYFRTRASLNLNFRFGIDAGKGGSVFINSDPIYYFAKDIWWAENWNNNQIIYAGQVFEPGMHKIQVLYAEGCCDGNQRIQFNKNGGAFVDFTPSALQQFISEEENKLNKMPLRAKIDPKIIVEEYQNSLIPEEFINDPIADPEELYDENDQADDCDSLTATLFSQCNYEGDSYVICLKDPLIKIDWEIKSIQVPENHELKLYLRRDYGGKYLTFESNPCIDQIRDPNLVAFLQAARQKYLNSKKKLVKQI